ncbi:hypothetical protein M5V91_17570 [Cytobacillus pseudoceanisediminis]|nr:hypothetical protein [Cytobacillus pseudoceanisediminis]UQX52760.1 hypothetical protein M5V91_17570 [Cytobacillus pseudoceanisediminis]
MSKLLVKENPIMILPSLAEKIGFNEAVMLQQIHYWLLNSKHVIEERTWIFNTYKDWKKQMTFWSETTIKRTIRSLEDQGFLISGNFNFSKMDKTKWYTIDYEKLAAEVEGCQDYFLASGTSQMELSSQPERPMEDAGSEQPIPETTAETATEKKILLMLRLSNT